LGGAVAKSAQLPLQTWLPDAMEGPTPVSALIHAATMVTAGVYLIVRTHAIFEQAPKVADLAAGLGAGTLLLAGLIALVQVDIKRVIAYSTMSQIGYMFLGVGLGAYANGMFHLMTHAFFKALLFMAAGIVIHALAAALPGCSLAAPVAVLAGLSVIGGWIQWVPLWHPIETWLQTVAEPTFTPANWQEWVSSALALLLGLSGMYVAFIYYGARRF